MSGYSELQETYSKSRSAFFASKEKCTNFAKTLEKELKKSLEAHDSKLYLSGLTYHQEGYWEFNIAFIISSPTVRPILPDDLIYIHFGVNTVEDAIEVVLDKLKYTIGTGGNLLATFVDKVIKLLFTMYGSGMLYFDEKQAMQRHINIVLEKELNHFE